MIHAAVLLRARTGPRGLVPIRRAHAAVAKRIACAAALIMRAAGRRFPHRPLPRRVQGHLEL